jgi:rsbT co-antagonist protein RsbR
MTNDASLTDYASFELVQSAIDAVPDAILVKDLQHRFVACNQACCVLLGKPREAILGRSDPDFSRPEEYEAYWRVDDQIVATGEPAIMEEAHTGPDGHRKTILTRKFPVRDAAGQIIGLIAIIADISDLKQRRDQVEQLEAEIADKLAIIQAQNSLLDELSVPVIQVWDGILLLPLVGVLDSRRAGRVLESLLVAIANDNAEVVILDITGVPVVDTSVASYLVRSVQAAQLLGCQSLLVGISPEIAQTLVGLGVDFSRIPTRSTLQSGLEFALKRLKYTVRREDRAAQ